MPAAPRRPPPPTRPTGAPCPVVDLQTSLKLGRIAHGPLFRRIGGGGKEAGPDRLTDKHLARLVKRTGWPPGSGAILMHPTAHYDARARCLVG
jgi:hypothetical protein